jgi:hypothetical protein
MTSKIGAVPAARFCLPRPPVVGRDGAGDEIAEGVSEHDGGSPPQLVDHAGDVVGEIVEHDTGRPSTYVSIDIAPWVTIRLPSPFPNFRK